MISRLQPLFSAGCNGACATPGYDPKTCKTDGCPMNPLESDVLQISSKPKEAVEACAVSIEEEKPKNIFQKIIEGITAFFKGFFQDIRQLFA